MEQNNEIYDDEDPFGGEYDASEDVVSQEDEGDDYDFDPGSDEDEVPEESYESDEDISNDAQGDSQFSKNYGSDKINGSISKRLSRARYNKINLELIRDLQPRVRVIPEKNVFEIMISSLGNSKKVKRGFRDNYSSAERYSTFLTNYNLGNYRYDPSVIMFSPSLFDGINIEKDDQEYLDFIKTVDSAEYIKDIAIMKCLSSTEEWGFPNYLLSRESSDYIKKLFSIELLNGDLQERIKIQKRLEVVMKDYENLLLTCYDSLSYLKSVETKTQEEYDLSIRIGMMHFALEGEGYEDIFKKEASHRYGIHIDEDELMELKKIAKLPQKITEEVVFIEKPMQSLFEMYGGTDFKISNYDKKFVTKKLENIRKYLEESDKDGVF